MAGVDGIKEVAARLVIAKREEIELEPRKATLKLTQRMQLLIFKRRDDKPEIFFEMIFFIYLKRRIYMLFH